MFYIWCGRMANNYFMLVATVVASSLVSCFAKPTGVTVGLESRYHPIQTLYHAQDRGGQYIYGYSAPLSSRSESRSADGITRGGYSYIDADGKLQTVQYTADSIHGFRVAASNLPTDEPDVAQAKAAHLASFQAIANEHAQIAAGNIQLPQPVTDVPEVAQARASHLAILQATYDARSVSALPQPVQDLPEVASARADHFAAFEATRARDEALRGEIALSPIPEQIDGNVVPIQTDYGYQPAAERRISYTPAVLEEPSQLTPYSYGYVGPHSSQAETQGQDGTVRGGYSYIDANGIVQTVHYIADASGFRVAATNLPVDDNHLRAAASAVAGPSSGGPAGGRIVASATTGHVEDQEPLEIVAAEEPAKMSSLYSTEVFY